jgi:hypothetical protein
MLKIEQENVLALSLRAMIGLTQGSFEASFADFKTVYSLLNDKQSENAKYLRLFAKIYIHRMSELDSDDSTLVTQALTVPCRPALKRWFPIQY